MEERREESIFPLFLLPQVKRETIVERFGDSLAIDIEPQGESIHDADPGILDFLGLLTENGSPAMSLGGLKVYDLLASEAQKRGKRLPHIFKQDIDDYFKNHPIMHMLGESTRRRKNKVSEEEARKMEAGIEYTPPSFEKFRPENPYLIEHLEQVYNRNIELARTEKGYNLFLVEQWRIGTLYTYELLRNQAEKERMKGLNI